MIEAADRWTRKTGADIKLDFGANTTAITPGSNEVLILMEDAPEDQDDPAALAVGRSTRIINVFRNNSSGPIPWVFTYPNNPLSSIAADFEAVITHEIGHELGLNQHSGIARATMGSGSFANCAAFYDWFAERSGPNENDAIRLRAIYPAATLNRLRLRVSGDNGGSWTPTANGLNGNSTVTSTLEPAALRDNSTTVVAFRNQNLHPEVFVGDLTLTTVTQHTEFATAKTLLAPALGGESNEWMLLYVDAANDDWRIRIKYTTDAGATWADKGPLGRAVGTPAVVKTASSTWYVAWPNIDPFNDFPFTGSVAVVRSTDDGTTWSSVQFGQDSSNNYATWTGVALSHLGSDLREVHDRTPFNVISTERGRVVSTSRDTSTAWPHAPASANAIATTSFFSTDHPSLARNNSGLFFLATRGKDSTSISAMTASQNGSWSTPVLTGGSGTPGLAADKDLGNVYLWYFCCSF